MKPKVAIFDFASCEGCELQIANLEEDILELLDRVEVVSFREVMKEHSDEYDIAFIEGSINRPLDEARIKDIRSKAKILIAMGDCACTGCVNKLRNDWSPDEGKKEVYPDAAKQMKDNEFFNIFPAKALNEVVDVDFYIRGCPVRKEQVLYYIKRLAFMPPVKNKDLDYKVILRNMELDDRSTVNYNPNKCILCRRCANICQDVLGVDALGVVEKGSLSIISTPQNIGFDANGCIKCGQCVSSCPVGALGTKSQIEKLVSELPKKKYTIALDSVALASFIQNHAELITMPPETAEKYIIAGLRKAGFKKIVSYDSYLALSAEKDSKAKKPVLASWCLSAQNYLAAKSQDALTVQEANSPWKLLIAEEGKRVCLLSPCTALKDVKGIEYVLTAPDLDELFKRMELDLEFMNPDKEKYDGVAVPKKFRHPGIPMDKGDFTVSKDVLGKIGSVKLANGPVRLYPCLAGCLNGGGNHPTIDESEIKARMEWVAKLRGVN